MWSTPFELVVPKTVVEPDVPGETIWLRFPDSVLPTEECLDWVTPAPAFAELSPKAMKRVKRDVEEVAGRLRSMNVAMLGIPEPDDTLTGLLGAIRTHVDSATRKILPGGHPPLETGCWDFHFACECALKALLRRKEGSFPKTHRLKDLYDLAAGHLPTFSAALLSHIPTWQEAVAYRYGEGDRLIPETYFEYYRATLAIIGQVLDPLVEIRLGEAQFKIARAPWKRPVS